MLYNYWKYDTGFRRIKMGCGTYTCESEFAGRSFLTKEEKIQKLEEYKEWLDSESKGVQEAIEKIKETG